MSSCRILPSLINRTRPSVISLLASTPLLGAGRHSPPLSPANSLGLISTSSAVAAPAQPLILLSRLGRRAAACPREPTSLQRRLRASIVVPQPFTPQTSPVLPR